MSCAYVLALRKIVKRAFISGNLQRKEQQVDLSVLQSLVADSKLHCKSLSFEEAVTLQNINGIKLDSSDGHTTIFFSSHLNYCWARFTVAKELCNVLMDGNFGDYHTQLPSDLLTQLSSLSFENGNAEQGLAPDLLAEVGACELLLPEQYSHAAECMIAKDGTHATAKFFGIPEVWVERRFGRLREFY